MLIGKTLTTIRCGNQVLDLSRPVVMGILNITPDSFFAPSRIDISPAKIIDFAGKILEEGATILDIGGMSTRPGATMIDASEESDRIVPVVEVLKKNFPGTILSVDTFRSSVARDAIKAGASLINDISGGTLDEEMFEVVASHRVAYCLMHMRGTPADMQSLADYQDLISDLLKYFVNKLRDLHRLGITDILVDPGFGFAKTMQHNYQLVNYLNVFGFLRHPVMIGVSRKSTLGKTIGRPAEETLEATTALHMAALQKGASVLRVHDVRPAMDAIAVYMQLKQAQNHY